MMPDITVIGSLNMDLVVAVSRMPVGGETIAGESFRMIPGGKGANQALAAARLGAEVAMVGCVGTDVFGDTLVHGLGADGIETSLVRRVAGVSTGVAMITVDAKSENSIIVVAGANASCRPDQIDAARDLIRSSKVIMLQLEIPLDTVIYAAKMAKTAGVTVVLDPAPVRTLPPAVSGYVDILTPNETEAEILTGRRITDVKSARLAAADILGMGFKTVLIKMGAAGVLWAEGNDFEHLEGFQVEAIDTTAAGDAFNAGLAVGLVQNRSLREALKIANATGALSTTGFGSQPSLPSRFEVEKLLQRDRGGEPSGL